MRRTLLLAAGGVAVATAAILLAGTGGDNGAAPAATTSGSTAAVQRRTLVDRQRADGTLGYPDTRAVLNRLPGTITKLPASGARIRAGQRLYEVDERPVILMDGRRPAHRALARGVSGGEDVRQLERNLVALGYDPARAITIDRHFDAATAAAVRRWRAALGLPAGDAVELGRVVFLPGTRRVTQLQASVGDVAGGQGAAAPVMKTSSTRQVVTLDLSAADATVARVGERVDVELPDSSHVRGRVARVGTVATAPADNGGGGSGDPTITVTVTLARGGGGARLDKAPVSVELARELRRNVLAVPVTALLAQRGGGYAVALADARGRRLVAVETGLFADGYVEVRGALRAGQRVTVPSQ